MGNFYTNITLLGPPQRDIASSLESMGCRAIVSPTRSEMTVVWDCASEAQDETIYRLAEYLAEKFKCVSLAVMVHDDDVLYYRLYASGKELDRYDSSPNYFSGPATPPAGGDAKIICEAFHAPEVQPQVNKLLHAWMNNAGEPKYVFEIDRHQDLVNSLKLSGWSVATGYKYLLQGEWPDGLQSAECIRVAGECSERDLAGSTRTPITDMQISSTITNGVLLAAALAVAYVVVRRFVWRA